APQSEQHSCGRRIRSHSQQRRTPSRADCDSKPFIEVRHAPPSSRDRAASRSGRRAAGARLLAAHPATREELTRGPQTVPTSARFLPPLRKLTAGCMSPQREQGLPLLALRATCTPRQCCTGCEVCPSYFDFEPE